MIPSVVRQLALHRLAIPMRRSFRHAAAERRMATPLVLELTLADGSVGYGETHPRPYVSGETPESVERVIEATFVPLLAGFRPQAITDVFEFAQNLPDRESGGAPFTAARAAVELALLDAYSRAFQRPLDMLGGWLGDPGIGAPGSLRSVRYSGVVSAESPKLVRRSIAKMRCYGLRDFKIKVGDDGDDERLRAAARVLRRGMRAGRCTLRIDANGAWDLATARQRLAAWRELGIACVEQPLPREGDGELPGLARECGVPIMVDESLITATDGERLIRGGGVAWFNIRLAKNGGLLPSLALARMARQAGLQVQLGCLVGETSILSAAGAAFLSLVPGVRFAEGSYGRFLLQGDVTQRPRQFGFGGRPTWSGGLGWNVAVNEALLRRFAEQRPRVFAL